MILSTVLLLVLLWDVRMSRLDGVVLLVAFVGYLVVLFVRPDESVQEAPTDERDATWQTALLLLGGLGAVVGAQFLVESAVFIAEAAGLSEWLIGETIVAVGTSTLEIAASVTAARKGMGDIAAGNLIGSNVFNALLILGITSALTPIEVGEPAVGTTVWLLGLCVLTAVFLGTNGKLGRLEGAVLVGINLSRWILDVF